MFCIIRIPFIFKILTLLVLLSMPLSRAAANAADVILTWNRPNDSRVTGYKIFYGTANADFKSTPKQMINSPGQTSCNIYDLKPGNTYYFAAKSFDRYNNESVFSTVISYDVPEIIDKHSNSNNGNDENIDDASEENRDNKNSNTINNDDGASDNNSGSSGGGGCFFQSISNINTCHF